MSGPDRQSGSAALAGAQAGSQSLERLRRGEVSLDEYLDDRTAHASRHLEATLSAEQLRAVRSAIREQLLTDPVLVELVRRATGQDVPADDPG